MKYVKDPELLIKYCEPAADAEVELQNCPFEYEYDGSPVSSPSVAVTPSQPTGILMLSVPSTSDSDGQSSPHENEEFETPPEQNNSSQLYFSGSDDPKPSTSAGVDFQHNNGDTDAVNQDNAESVYLGNDSDDLGFANRREIDLRDICELQEQLRKRYRVSEEDLDVKTSFPIIVKKEAIVIEIDQTQTQEVDMEVIERVENFKDYERRIVMNADSSTLKMSEKGEEEGDGGEVLENSERGANDNEKLNGVGTGEMHLNGIKDVVGEGDANGEGDVVSMNLDENEKLNGICAKEMHSKGITRSVGVDDGDGERGEVSMYLDENEKSNGVCTKEMHSNGITRSMSVDDGDGEGCVVSMNLDENGKLNGVYVKEVHSNGITRSVGVNDADSEGCVVSMNLDENGKLNGVCAKEMHSNGITRSVGIDDGGAGSGRRVAKNGTFKDLMEAFSMVVGDVSGDDKNSADFLETAKRRGLSFPRPRWWPPEGFAD